MSYEPKEYVNRIDDHHEFTIKQKRNPAGTGNIFRLELLEFDGHDWSTTYKSSEYPNLLSLILNEVDEAPKNFKSPYDSKLCDWLMELRAGINYV